ncbi:MAG: SDR family oxidoreductase [Thermodesulfobacteriota bacterium]
MNAVYFITGATGAIGAALVPELLEIPGVRLKLLFRATDPEHLETRFAQLCAFWGHEPQALRQRIEPVAGDMTWDQFGLAPATYADLERECTHIVHCAGNVRMNISLEEARGFSVRSVQNVVALAQQCQAQGVLKKVDVVSTVGVGGDLSGVVPERFLDEQRNFHNTYEEAKAEAETVLRPYAEKKELPLTIHRPSMVVGATKTGKILHYQIFYHLCEFLAGRRTAGIVPRLQGKHLDIVPVDYVAQAIARSSRAPEWAGEVLHLCAGPDGALDLMELMEGVRQVFAEGGIRLPRSKPIALGLFQRLVPVLALVSRPKLRRALRTLPVFFAYLGDSQEFATVRSRELLAKAGLPAFDAREVARSAVTAYVRSQGE